MDEFSGCLLQADVWQIFAIRSNLRFALQAEYVLEAYLSRIGKVHQNLEVGQFESKHALSLPKSTGRRGLYKTVSLLCQLVLYRPPAFWAGSSLFRSQTKLTHYPKFCVPHHALWELGDRDIGLFKVLARSKPKQFNQIAAENGFLLRVVQGRRVQNQVHV